MENNFKEDSTLSEVSNDKKNWVTPEFVFLPMAIIKGDSWPGDDGSGVFTSS